MPSLGMDPMEMARSHDTGIAAAGASMAASIESVGGSIAATLNSFERYTLFPCVIVVGGLVIVVGGLACTVVYYKVVAPEISNGLRKHFKEEEDTADAISKVYIPLITIGATTIIAGGLGCAWYFFKRG